MKQAVLKLFVILLIGVSIFIGCERNNPGSNPIMEFVVHKDYSYEDDTIASGDTTIVGLKCNWNGSDNLQSIVSYLNDQLINNDTVPELGREGFTLIIKLAKTQTAVEKWDFELNDAGGNKAELSLTLINDSSGGTIVLRPLLLLGAQGNTSNGSFYSTGTNKIYSLTNAETNQATVNILAGYDASNKIFLASPGATDLTGVYDLSSWTTKNSTKFHPAEITIEQFELINTAALIIPSYGKSPVDKAKNLKKDDIYTFKTIDDKYGILKVNEVEEGATGFVSFDIKIQID